MPKSSLSSKDHSSRLCVGRVSSFAAKTVLLALIAAYRVALRPILGPACRFAPSCSQYADEAIRRHGPIVGFRLAVRRLASCHPWNPGGYDPVPNRSR
jgi:putative membrane protein insertion efficiency factor